jgi:hypothetical protein
LRLEVGVRELVVLSLLRTATLNAHSHYMRAVVIACWLLAAANGGASRGAYDDESWSFDRPASVHERSPEEDQEDQNVPTRDPSEVPGLPAPKPLVDRVVA